MEWKRYQLKDVCSRLSSGKNIKADNVLQKGPYPVYGGNGLRGYSLSSNFKGSCAIIGRQGAYCGNVRYFNGEAHMTEHAVVVQGNEFADNYYLACLLSTMHLERLSGQSAQPGLAVGTLAVQEIELPPIEYQTRIASILSSLDRKIELNNKINAQLEEMAQAIFKSWFVDFEPFKDGKFVESELGMIPERWRVGIYTDIAELCPGGTPKTSSPEYWEDGTIPFFSPKDITGVFCYDTEKHITEAGLNNCSSRYYDADTVFITCRGTVGKVTMTAVKMAMNQSNYALLAKDGYSQYFIYFKTFAIIEKLLKKANGAVFSAITSKDFKEIIIIPPVNVVEDFDLIIKPILSKIKGNGFENLHLSQLRDTLLPKLMSGEIDLDEIEKTI